MLRVKGQRLEFRVQDEMPLCIRVDSYLEANKERAASKTEYSERNKGENNAVNFHISTCSVSTGDR